MRGSSASSWSSCGRSSSAHTPVAFTTFAARTVELLASLQIQRAHTPRAAVAFEQADGRRRGWRTPPRSARPRRARSARGARRRSGSRRRGSRRSARAAASAGSSSSTSSPEIMRWRSGLHERSLVAAAPPVRLRPPRRRRRRRPRRPPPRRYARAAERSARPRRPRRRPQTARSTDITSYRFSPTPIRRSGRAPSKAGTTSGSGRTRCGASATISWRSSSASRTSPRSKFCR